MNDIKGETMRMIMRGRGKALIVQSCGPTCGMFDGSLCEDCYDRRRKVDREDVEDIEE